jgi:hypothetical protein
MEPAFHPINDWMIISHSNELSTMLSCMLTGDILYLLPKLCNVRDFTGSHGWIDRFKKRFNVQEYVCCGEANSTSLEDSAMISKTFCRQGT